MTTDLPTYGNWEDVPEHLKTRTSLKKLGLRPKRGQQPAALKTHWDYKIPTYQLFDVRECEPYTVSEAQKAALEKAQAKSLEARTCTRCGFVEELSRHYRGKWYVQGGLCPRCHEEDERAEDRDEVVEWARDLLTGPFVIFDSETTGLSSGYSEFVQLGVIDHTGAVLLDTLVSPEHPERMLERGERGVCASDIHGLTPESVKDAPRFPDVYPALVEALKGRKVIIYNADFDLGILRGVCRMHGLEMPKIDADCAMLCYSQYVGEWSSYWGSYRYQALPWGDHSAVGDCKAVLRLLKGMAKHADESNQIAGYTADGGAFGEGNSSAVQGD